MLYVIIIVQPIKKKKKKKKKMFSVILFFRVLCNFVFPGVLSFSWPVRHFYFPLMKKKD